MFRLSRKLHQHSVDTDSCVTPTLLDAADGHRLPVAVSALVLSKHTLIHTVHDQHGNFGLWSRCLPPYFPLDFCFVRLRSSRGICPEVR